MLWTVAVVMIVLWILGKVSMNPGLEAEGKDENLDGIIQEKIGRIKKIVGK